MNTLARRLGVLACLSLGLGAALWLVLGPGTGQGQPGSALPAEPESDGTESSRVELGALPGEELSAPLGERQSLSQEASPDVLGSDALGSAELCVVDGPSGAPLPGVRVFVDAPSAEEREQARQAPDVWAARLARAEAHGQPLLSDEAGRVWIAEPEGTTFVAARHEGRAGLLWVRAQSERPWTLELWPDCSLAVRVHDALDQPHAHLPLVVRLREERRRDAHVLRVWTDAEGWARWPRLWARAAPSADQSWVVVPEAILPGRPEPSFDAPWEGALERSLELPALGRARVSVLEPGGDPWAFGQGRDPRLQVRDLGAQEGWTFGRDTEAQLRLPTAGRDAGLAWVGLGLQLEAVCRLDSDFELSARGAGPVRAGEERAFEIQLGSEHPLLRMRLVDEAGQPLPDLELRLGLARYGWKGGGSSGSHDARTDADGVLVLALAPVREGARQTLHLASIEEPVREARPALPPVLDNRTHDLGDVRLVRPPIQVRGSVVDDSGQPASGARIEVRFDRGEDHWPSFQSELDARAARADTGPLDVERLREQWSERRRSNRFDYEPGVRVAADDAGQFEVRASEGVLELRLEASAPGGATAAPVVVPAGSLDVRLSVNLPTRVEGRVLVPAGLDREDLRVSLHRVWREEDRGRGFPQPSLSIDAEGRWSIESIATGPWNLTVRDHTSFGWEGLLPDVRLEVQAGLNRAPDLDLRSALRILFLDVVDEHGVPLESAEGSYWASGTGANNDIRVHQGRARVMTSHAHITGWIGAPGRRCVQVDPIEDGLRVVLPPALPVRLRLEQLAALPPSDYELVAQLDTGLGRDNWVLGGLANSPQIAFDSSGEAVLEGRVLGEQRVRLLVRPVGEPNRQRQLPSEIWPTVVLADEQGEQVFPLTLDPERTLRAVEHLEAP